MATAFPLSTYPLSDRTQLNDDEPIIRDLLDDGSFRIRYLGFSSHQIARCTFRPMSKQLADTFMRYLRSNRATEFDLTLDFVSPTITITGYIWSEPRKSSSDGLDTVTFDFRGTVA